MNARTCGYWGSNCQKALLEFMVGVGFEVVFVLKFA